MRARPHCISPIQFSVTSRHNAKASGH